MRQFCALRSESIAMQLENGETTENMNYVDASGLTVSNMGSMGMGGGRGEGFDPSKMEGGFPGRTETEAGTEQKTETMRPDRGNMPMPGGFNMGMNGMNETSGNATLIWLAVSILILAVGLIIAKLYRW